MFKLPQYCTHFTCYQGNAQNPLSSASTICELEIPNVLSRFRKSRGTRDQIANTCLIIEKAREFQKNIYFCFIDYPEVFDYGSQHTVENCSRDGNTRPPYLPPEKSVCRSRSKSQNWTRNNRLVPNQERSTSRLYIVTLFI